MSHPFPIIVLSGFLGVDKTTPLNRVFANREGKRMAVIVNDLSNVNINVQLMDDGTATSAQLSRTDERMVELSNGCIYCMLREDLLGEIVRLTREDRFDYLLIEPTGVVEPLPIVETSTFEGVEDDVLSDLACLDIMIIAIDVQHFLAGYDAANFLFDRGQARDEDNDRTVVDLLIEQTESCDAAVFNEIDLVSNVGRERLAGILHLLNPWARIMSASFGAVPLGGTLDAYRSDFDTVSAASAWLAELRGEHVPETEALGIGSFVYRRRVPSHSQRLWNPIHTEWLCKHGRVLCSEGYFWLASHMDTAGSWGQAGGVMRHDGTGAWWVAVDEVEWLDEEEARADIADKMHDNGAPACRGDRHQELIFIGMNLDGAALIVQLDAHLLTDAEMAAGLEAWVALADPSPAWAYDDHGDENGDDEYDRQHDDDCDCDHHH